MTATSDGAPRLTTDVDDHDLAGQADWVIGGDAGRRSRRQAWYAAYVVTLAAVAYGFPIVQGVVKTADPAALRAQLETPLALVVLVAGIAAALGAVHATGRHRGPVVPPLPWIDHVVSSPIDRAVATGRWWRLALGLSVFVGALGGLTIGAGVAFAGMTGWYAAGLGTLVGALLGWLAARLWLAGQVGSWLETGGERPRRGARSSAWSSTMRPATRNALRALHIEVLRRHAANSSTVAGSVLAGNLRTTRLELARPVRRARRARLRAAGPVGIMVRRDVLGMRRLPSTFWTGLGLMALATVVIVWTLTHSAVPVVAMTIALVPGYLGFGSWAEGLRLQADNVGTPTLLGTPPRAETLAHLVVPGVLTLVVLSAGIAVAGLTGTAVTGPAVGLALPLVALLAGGHVLAAFRGTSPKSTLRADSSGPFLLVAWYLFPSLAVVVGGTVMALVVRANPEALVWCTVLAGALVWGGLARAQRLTEEHRI